MFQQIALRDPPGPELVGGEVGQMVSHHPLGCSKKQLSLNQGAVFRGGVGLGSGEASHLN